jgi:hypothetical protein
VLFSCDIHVSACCAHFDVAFMEPSAKDDVMIEKTLTRLILMAVSDIQQNNTESKM